MYARVIIVSMSANGSAGRDTQLVQGSGIEYFATFEVSSEPGGSVTFEGTLNESGGFQPTPDRGLEFDPTLEDTRGELPTEGGSFIFVPQNLAEVRQRALSSAPQVDTNLASRVLGPVGAAAVPSAPDLVSAVGGFEFPSTIRLTIDSTEPGQQSSSITERISIPNITIPTLDEEEALQNIPPLTFEATWREERQALDVISQIGGQGSASTTVSIDPRDFVTFREPAGCEEAHPDITSNLSNAEQALRSIQDTVNSRAERVEDAANQVLENIPQDLGTFSIDTEIDIQSVGGDSQLIADGGANPLQQLTPDIFANLDPEPFQDAAQTLRVIPSSEPSPGFDEVRSRINEAQIDLDGSVRQECREDFGSRADTALSNLNRVEEIFDEYTSAMDRLTTLLGQVAPGDLNCFQRNADNPLAQRVQSIREQSPENVDPEEVRDIIQTLGNPDRLIISEGCADRFISQIEGKVGQQVDAIECAQQISSSLQNQINGFETEARNIPRVARPQSIARLISEGNSLVEQINAEDIPEECKSKFRSRVRSQIANLRQKRGIERIDCASEFSGVAQDVEDFRGQVASFVSPSRQQLDELSSEAQDLIGTVRDDVNNAECQEEFINQIRASLNRLREQTVRLNIDVGEAGEEFQERQEQIQQLQEQVNSFLNSISGDIGDVEAPGLDI